MVELYDSCPEVYNELHAHQLVIRYTVSTRNDVTTHLQSAMGMMSVRQKDTQLEHAHTIRGMRKLTVYSLKSV